MAKQYLLLRPNTKPYLNHPSTTQSHQDADITKAMASDWMNKQTAEISRFADSRMIRLFDSNMLISNTTAVICLDDYHSLDMTWRKEKEVTMLDPRATDFDLMYKQMKAIKEGKAVEKPIYTMFLVAWILLSSSSSPKILVIEGLRAICMLQSLNWIPRSRMITH
ncbi:hypothetical protein FF1_013175 [Malus domestica]